VPLELKPHSSVCGARWLHVVECVMMVLAMMVNKQQTTKGEKDDGRRHAISR
jgi:hypothetical protein